MSTFQSQGVSTPGAENEVFSTPPTTPGFQILRDAATELSSSRKGKPASLQMAEVLNTEWNPHLVLENTTNPNASGGLSFSTMAHTDTNVPQPTALPKPRSHVHQTIVESPCFVHSHLNKGASLTDWLRDKHAAENIDSSDLGVAKSLQRINDRLYNAPVYSPFSTPVSSRASNVDSDGEDDEFVGSLTKQLAETAVGVREMSKQLGRACVQSNIQTVLIVTKARDNRLIKLTRELALYLMLKKRPGMKRGLVVYVDSQLRTSKRFDAEYIRREHPELFIPLPRRRTSSGHSSSNGSPNGNGSANSVEDFQHEDGQLRYWTSDMCSHSPHLFDFVVTLGGDGTVLFTSWLFQRIVPPVLSFALGSLGFLTNFDFADYKAVMDSAIDQGIRVNLRMRFTCTVYRAVVHAPGKGRKAVKKAETGEILMKNIEKGGWEAVEGGWSMAHSLSEGKIIKDKEIMCFTTRPVEQFEVLNDLVVDRGPSPYVSQLELFGDEHHMTTVQADGLTIATPTGSTAYSLSAGGSLVHPEIPAILITPICPHTLSFRPMLLPDTMELRICVPYNSRSTAWASFDGRGRIELKQGDHIKVTASKYPFPSVCADNQSTDWFHAISRTLKWNERERQKSFVVVEENPAKPRKHSKRKQEASEHVDESLVAKNISDEEEDEVSSEEDEFDIDDSSAKYTTRAIVSGLTADEQALGAEKVREAGLDKTIRDAGKDPGSRAVSTVHSNTLYEQSLRPSISKGYSRHVGFDLPESIDRHHVDESGLLHAAHDGSRDELYTSRPISARSRIPERDRDSEELARTPTASDLLQSRARARSRSRSRSRDKQYGGHHAFAVWGNDESDSNASDSDCS